MNERGKPTRSMPGWLDALIGAFDALETLALGGLLVFFGTAVLVGPYVLARDLLAGALVVPAALAIAASAACVVAVGIAWRRRGLRWWYFGLLLLVSAAITETGRTLLDP